MTIDVLDTERPKLKYAPQRVRVSARTIPDGLRPATSSAGVARLGPPSGPTRPDGYDFSFNSYFDGIGANGFFLTGPELARRHVADAARRPLLCRSSKTCAPTLPTTSAPRIGGARGRDRRGTRRRRQGRHSRRRQRSAAAHRARPHPVDLRPAHGAGRRDDHDRCCALGFAFFPDFASRRPVKKYAASAALVALAVYLFISGIGGRRRAQLHHDRRHAHRGMLFDRAALTMRNLAISAIVIIVVSPHEVAGPSFQMSFAATAALIGAYAGWSERRRARPAPHPPDEGRMRKAGAPCRRLCSRACRRPR